MVISYLLVGLGGALGAMLRHGVGALVLKFVGTGFPWGTMFINVSGSLVIGFLAALLGLAGEWGQSFRLFVVVGVLGGFTTFSAFSLETLALFERGQVASALLYAIGSVVFSVLAAFLGTWVMRVIAV